MMLVYESQVKGSCQGYKNNAVFELTNGRIFEQNEPIYQHNYQFNPDVKVYQEGSVFYLEIKGMHGKVKVKKVK